MPRKRHTPEEIIGKLRAVEVEMAKGRSAQQACRKIGATEQTCYRRRKDSGGLRLDLAMRMVPIGPGFSKVTVVAKIPVNVMLQYDPNAVKPDGGESLTFTATRVV